jgi:hypothetical protein
MAETFTTKKLGEGAFTTSFTNIYQATAGRAVVTTLALCNVGTVTRNLTLRAGVGPTIFVNQRPLLPNETLFLQLNLALNNLELLQGLVDAGTDVNFHASGVEIT